MVTASELKATKDGTGQYLELTLEIQSGPSQGRRLWDQLNLQNRNPKAVEIAQKQLAQLCHATGILQLPNDATPLHNRPVVMKVAVKNDPERGPINEIKGLQGQGRDQCAGFPGAARNSASRDGCTGHALGESGLRWLHWPFAPTSSWLRPRLMPSMPQC